MAQTRTLTGFHPPKPTPRGQGVVGSENQNGLEPKWLRTQTCIYIRRPLQSVERVRLHLLAYKATLEEDISPASPGGQAAEI